MGGWFAIKRGALDHEFFAPKGPYSRFEAWVWMIENAPYKDGEVKIKGKMRPVKRGHLYHSIRFMAGKFRWSEKAVRTFINGLEKRGAVEKIGAHLGAHYGAQLRLCNYEEYQSEGHTKGHTKGHKVEQGITIPVGEASVEAPADPVKIIFSEGVKILLEGGVKEAQARSLLGKWRKEYGDAPLIDALGKCQRNGAIQPIEFITGCLKAAKKQAVAQSGERRQTADGKTLEFEQGVGWQEVHA